MQTTLFGRRVAYEDTGSGIPLVLIHGYPLNRTMWEPQLQGLSDGARVIAPDLRGFGESEPVEGETSVGSYADDVRELLDALGVNGPAVLCGLSMGGYIVFEYLRRYPGHVGGVILANTKAGADTAEGRAGRDRSAATARQNGAEAIADAMLPKMLAPATYQNNPELVQRVRRMITSSSVPGIVAALMAMRDRPDSTMDLAMIDKPALALTGADDQLIPPSEAETIARDLPGARLEVLPNAGHLSNLEQPELFNRAVRELLGTLNY